MVSLSRFWGFILTLLICTNPVTGFTQVNALRFDGSSDYVNCGTNASLNLTGNSSTGSRLTIEAWIYPTSWRTNVWEGCVINKSGTTDRGYMLRVGNSGSVNFNLGNSSWNEITTGTNAISLNTWSHIAGTWDGSTMRLYINGVLVGTRALSSLGSSTNPLYLGSDPMFSGRNYPGRIDEVRIWNVARTQTQIQADMNTELCLPQTGLVAYYKLNQGVANGSNAGVTTAIDETGTNNGTLNTFTLSGTTSNWTNGKTLTIPSVNYSSSSCTQTITSDVDPGQGNAQIIGVQISTGGCGTSSLTLDRIQLNTQGSTDPTNDIAPSGVKIYTTGTSSTFATTTPFGSSQNPQATGATIDVTGSYTIPAGTSYYWIVYDISPSATLGNVVDASVVGIRINGVDYVPTNNAPAGNRLIALIPNPGGLGRSNLTGWWKADNLSNGNVTSWITSYPSAGSAINVTDGASPYSQASNTPTNNIFNYNRVVDFTGNTSANNKFLSNTTTQNFLSNQSSGNQGTFFAIFAAPSSGGNDGVVTWRNAVFDAVQLRSFGRLAIGSADDINGTRDFTPEIATKPLIIAYKGNKSGASTMTAFKNDIVYTGGISSSAVMDNNSLTFGAKIDGGIYNEFFEGYLSEVIFYNTDLSNAGINKVNSYLAIKYGTTLDNTGGVTQGDYTSTNNSTVWDASVSPSYHNDVIGIARDDNQALYQKQSHSFDDSLRVYRGTLSSSNEANTSTFTANDSYLMMGHNQGQNCATVASSSEMPTGLLNCNLYSRLEREWKVTKTNFTDTVNMDFKLNTCASPTMVNTAELRFLVDDDGDFSNGGTTCYYNGDGTGIVISYNNPTITVSNISNTQLANNATRYITIASTSINTPLPVELLYFDANAKENKVQLEWKTVTEINNDYFEVLKSVNAENWEKIAVIQGAGTTTTEVTYETYDNNPYAGTSYYKLKQVDFDGAYEYSDIRAVRFEENSMSTISLYPNPSSDGNFTITKSNTPFNNGDKCILYNALGQVIQQHAFKNETQTFDFTIKNGAGIYIATINTGEKVYNIRFVVR